MEEGFWESLKSGILLCKAINAIRPSTIDPKKIGTRVNAMVERANIQLYLDACTKLGMDKSDLFLPSDLNERKYLSAVLQNILALAQMVENRPGYYGPSLFGGVVTSASGTAPLHRRSRSFGGALKPWDFDQQMKETANRVAEEKRASEESIPLPTMAPVMRQAIAATPATRPAVDVSAASMPSGPRKKTEERYVFKLLKALVPITKSDGYDIDADMRVLKQQRVKSLEHLLILIGHKDYWAKLDLSLVTKCCVEEALTNPSVRSVGGAKEKVKQVKAIIERGDVLVPNSDDLIADLEAQEAEAAAAMEEQEAAKESKEKTKKAKKSNYDDTDSSKEKERIVVEPPRRAITKMHIPIELVNAPAPAPVAPSTTTTTTTSKATPMKSSTPEKKTKKEIIKEKDQPTSGKKRSSGKRLVYLVPIFALLFVFLAVSIVCSVLRFAPHTPLAQNLRTTLTPYVGEPLLRTLSGQ